MAVKPQLHRHLGETLEPRTEVALLPACRRLFRQRFERFCLELPVFLQQDLNFSFRLLEFLPARRRKLHAFFKEREGFLQRDLSLFQFLNNFLQSLEALFKLGQRGFAPSLIVCNYFEEVSSVF